MPMTGIDIHSTNPLHYSNAKGWLIHGQTKRFFQVRVFLLKLMGI